MRLARLLIPLIAAAALSACAHQPSLPEAQMAGSELDALAYGGPIAQRTAPRRAVAAVSVRAVPARAMAQAYIAESAMMPAEMAVPVHHVSYTLDSGDKLRIVVFGQDALSNNYNVDAAGRITMPLIGAVRARGLTTSQLSAAIASRLKSGFIRDPSVAVEVETYRPFFVLGEVTYPGQYPYVPDMTVEKAVAIAGGFTPRAHKYDVTVTRKTLGVPEPIKLPLDAPIRPGDTITVAERWF